MSDREDLIDALAHMAEEIADDVRREPIKHDQADNKPKGGKRR